MKGQNMRDHQGSNELDGGQKQVTNQCCKHEALLLKANKLVTKKNREIDTLNRIIKNLKIDNSQLSDSKQRNKQQCELLKFELEKTKQKINELEMRQIQSHQAAWQEQLERVTKLKGKRESKLRRDFSNQYYSQCHASRYTNQDRHPASLMGQNERKNDRFQALMRTSKENASTLTMGELFMGRKLKIEMHNGINKEPNWGKFDRMNQKQRPALKYNNLAQQPSALLNRKINVEDALSYIRRENQGLKVSIF